MAGVSRHVAQANRRRTIYHEQRKKPVMAGESMTDEEFMQAVDQRIRESIRQYVKDRSKEEASMEGAGRERLTAR